MNEDDIIAYLMSVAGWQPTPPPPIGDDGGLSNTDVPQSERDSQEEIVRQLRDIEERLRKLERQLGADLPMAEPEERSAADRQDTVDANPRAVQSDRSMVNHEERSVEDRQDVVGVRPRAVQNSERSSEVQLLHAQVELLREIVTDLTRRVEEQQDRVNAKSDSSRQEIERLETRIRVMEHVMRNAERIAEANADAAIMTRLRRLEDGLNTVNIRLGNMFVDVQRRMNLVPQIVRDHFHALANVFRAGVDQRIVQLMVPVWRDMAGIRNTVDRLQNDVRVQGAQFRDFSRWTSGEISRLDNRIGELASKVNSRQRDVALVAPEDEGIFA